MTKMKEMELTLQKLLRMGLLPGENYLSLQSIQVISSEINLISAIYLNII